MVSPSKIQKQKNDKKSRQSRLAIQKGDKPLEKKRFYLDIKNHVLADKLETRIKKLGGRAELFLDQRVTFVVSDRAEKFEPANSDKRKWGYISGGSAGPPSLRSAEVPTPTWTPTSFNGECPLSNSTNTRVHTTQRTKSRVDAMLERALTQPQQCSVDPLDNAFNWGIPIWTTDKLQAWLDKIYASIKDNNTLKSVNRISAEKDLKTKDFKKSFIKFESYKRDTRPVFLELQVWPTINFDGEAGSCPFEKPREAKEEEKKSDNLKNINNKTKEMTRKPRANATRARRSEQLVAGYCEICRCDYKDLTKHVQSDKHLAFVRNDDNFLSLDTLINAGAGVEAFLKLNQPDDVEKDLFSNDKDNLDDVIRNEKNKSAKSDLSDFGMDELKVVQCNGARRKLNLKYNSPHNLRTRAKHESGHLLRSKGSPWHEMEKGDKFYDKFEGYTIKKRAKGTIWIEEDTSDKCSDDERSDKEWKGPIIEKSPLSELNDVRVKSKESGEQTPKKNQLSRIDERKERKKVSLSEQKSISENVKGKNNPDELAPQKKSECNSRLSLNEDKKSPSKEVQANGALKPLVSPAQKQNNIEIVETTSNKEKNAENVDNVETEENNEKSTKVNAPTENEMQDIKEKSRYSRVNKRNVRSRMRPRLSVEERLIEDNRAYYKVEVLGNKLRSSTAHLSNNQSPPVKEIEKEVKKDDGPSSEKPVVVRFKRVRKSELSLLSDEAESFMFGDSRRDDWSNSSNDERSNTSVLPNDTESEDEINDESIISSPEVSPVNSPVKAKPPPTDSPVKGKPIPLDSPAKGKPISPVDSPAKGRPIPRADSPTKVRSLLPTDSPAKVRPILPADSPAKVRSIPRADSPAKVRSLLPTDSPAKVRPILPADSPAKVRSIPPADSPAKVRPIPPADSPTKIELSSIKTEPIPLDEDSQDSTQTRVKKRRRTQADLLLGDYTDYYKFETPGSRLRFQGPSTPAPAPSSESEVNLSEKPDSLNKEGEGENGESTNELKLYPSKPSAEVEKMRFSFESIPKSEPWYQTYQRQDEGAEFWHSFSENETKKPFLLPYEIENFHENLLKLCQKNDIKKKARSRGPNGLARSPRKSPRCHASTLAIMSTIIRKREQQRQQINVNVVNEEPRSGAITPKPEAKSSTDQEIKEIAQSIDDMLNVDANLEDSFESDLLDDNLEPLTDSEPAGPPLNLIELLNSSNQQYFNGLENSSCASSECGEVLMESPLKRRKRRKNRTGWPGIRARKKMQKLPAIPDVDSERENVPSKMPEEEEEEEEEEDDDEEEEERNATIQSICERLQQEEDEDRRCKLAESENQEEKNYESDDPLAKAQETNDENHENVLRQDLRTNSINNTRQQINSKLMTRRRQKESDARPSSSMTIDSHPEIENHDLYRQKPTSGIISRKNYSTGTLAKRRRDEKVEVSEAESPLVDNQRESPCKKKDFPSPKKSKARKRSRKSTSETSFEDENCKKDDIEVDVECKLSERMSTDSVTVPEVQQRRSSIEFQPVVRVMKIEDQVEMDHNILSVTVASNRRLRSSTSPKLTKSPPAKRYKRSKGPFGRWIKNS